MNKKAKPVACPNCGSIHKTEPRPDHFICSNCGSYYYLDSDEVNVNINYNTNTLNKPQSSKRLILALVVGIVFIAFVFIMLTLASQSTRSAREITKEKEPYRFSGNDDRVYRNQKTDKAVFLRLGTEYIDDGDSNRDEVNFHAVYIDPITKTVLKDEVIIKNAKRLDSDFNFFSDYLDGSSFIIYKTVLLFKIDKAENKLVNVTDNLIKQFNVLAAGIAKFESLVDNHIEVTTNDGEKFIYIPGSDQLFETYDDAKVYLKSKRKYVFRISDNRLKREDNFFNEKILKTDRRFFDGYIIYQDSLNLMVKSHTVANNESPSILQSIDINNGDVRWSLPARKYNYRYVASLKDGFAVKYYAEDETYNSGVYILAADGEILHDYRIGRNQ